MRRDLRPGVMFRHRRHITAGQMRFAAFEQRAQAIEPGVLQRRADHEHICPVTALGDAFTQPVAVRDVGAWLQIHHQQRSRRIDDGLPETLLLAVMQMRLVQQRFDTLLQALGRCTTPQAGADKQDAGVRGLAHDGLQNGPAV